MKKIPGMLGISTRILIKRELDQFLNIFPIFHHPLSPKNPFTFQYESRKKIFNARLVTRNILPPRKFYSF